MTPRDIEQLAGLAGLTLPAGTVIDGADPVLPSRFHLGEAAALALADAADGAASLSRDAGGSPGPVRTSALAGACAIISFGLQRIDGEVIPRTNQSNPFVRPYRCGDDRWVFIHGGFPGLAAGLADLLGVAEDADRAAVGEAMARWSAQALEDAIGEHGLCGVVVRTPDEWLAHPHGAAIAELDTVTVTEQQTGSNHEPWQPSDSTRPLAGLRVLDLTRVLAGPTCGRTLAAFGADVLQVTGPDVPNVPAFVIDTGHGKRRALCDLADPAQAEHLRRLAEEAHVVVQGYRPGVIARHGLDETSLRDRGWDGIYGSISCFGPSGPMSDRAGWEQLAQSTSGIALTEGAADGSPTLVPAAATDYTTGLLLAARIIRALVHRAPARIDASLCQTAMWLLRAGANLDPADAVGVGSASTERQLGDFGEVDRLGFGAEVDGLDIGWAWSARRLDHDTLSFS